MTKRVNLAAAVALGLLANTGIAQAETHNDPWGSADTFAMVGTDPFDGNSQWIGWFNMDTFECAWTWLADGNGLTTWIDLFGLGGSDILEVSSAEVSFCGFILGEPIFNNFEINMDGGDGNDELLSEGGTPVNMWGQGGNDTFRVGYQFPQVFGGPGADRLVGMHPNHGGWYDMGSGNDCLESASTRFESTQICGSGFDQWSAPGSRPPGCEQTVASCD